MRNNPIAFACVLAALAVAVPASGAGLRFLKDAPIGQFTDDDMALFERTLRDGLDSTADGKDVSWSNSGTGAGGTVTFVETRMHEGQRCRKARLRNKARGREGDSTHWFCREPSGEWKARALN